MPFLKVNGAQKAIVKAIANTWHDGDTVEALESLLADHRTFRHELDGYRWPVDLPNDLDDLMEKISRWGREEFKFPLLEPHSVWLTSEEIFKKLGKKWRMPEGYTTETLQTYLKEHLYELGSDSINRHSKEIFSTRHKYELKEESGVYRFRYSPSFEAEFNDALAFEMSMEEP